MKIPYGLSSFAMVRGEGYFYVDKTPFLPLLESAESGHRYLIFLRPWRMGKSLLLDFSNVCPSGHRLYVLIDEYDTFANSLLSAGQEDLYATIVERTGFLDVFYRTLKTGTQSGVVSRIVIAGASRVVLDELASGFTIATDISQDARLNALVGFTRAEVGSVDAALPS